MTAFPDPSAPWTAGAMVATAGDVARWAVALYGGKAIAPAALEEMLKDPLPADVGLSYGLGTMFLDEPLLATPAMGHAGGIPGFLSWMLYRSDQQVAVVGIVNDSSKNALPIAASALEIALAQ